MSEDQESVRPGLKLELFVSDIAASITFYVDALGFEVVRSHPDGYASLRRGEALIGLNLMTSLPDRHPARARAGERQGLGVEVVVLVQDVEAAYERATEKGAEISMPLGGRPWGLADFRLQDPDGIYIRVSGLSSPTRR